MNEDWCVCGGGGSIKKIKTPPQAIFILEFMDLLRLEHKF